MSERVEAPWSPEQVDALMNWQTAGEIQPYTGKDDAPLIPTPEGWVETFGGPVVQTWAWDYSFDPEFIARVVSSLKEVEDVDDGA